MGIDGRVVVKTGSVTKQMLTSEVQGSFKWGQLKKWAEKWERMEKNGNEHMIRPKKLKKQTRHKQQEPGKEKYLARRSEDQDRRVT